MEVKDFKKSAELSKASRVLYPWFKDFREIAYKTLEMNEEIFRDVKKVEKILQEENKALNSKNSASKPAASSSPTKKIDANSSSPAKEATIPTTQSKNAPKVDRFDIKKRQAEDEDDSYDLNDNDSDSSYQESVSSSPRKPQAQKP